MPPRWDTTFTKLNETWDADPNVPDPHVHHTGTDLVLTFFLRTGRTYGERLGELTFSNCWRHRLGATNDEGWYRKHCRFSLVAPDWGEFYEVTGNLRLFNAPDDWIVQPGPEPVYSRHFLFYFRDETFECDALNWSFRILPASR